MSTKRIRLVVNDKMQRDYVYFLSEPVGENFHPDFKPQLTPKQMLELHVSQVKKNCQRRDMKCRPRQRQALLHWAYDSRRF